jgi:adenylosuccinate lyase
VLLALVGKGYTREKAYAVDQRNALRAWREEMDFKRLVSADPEVRAKMDQAEIDKCFDLSHHLKNVDHVLKRAGVL